MATDIILKEKSMRPTFILEISEDLLPTLIFGYRYSVVKIPRRNFQSIKQQIDLNEEKLIKLRYHTLFSTRIQLISQIKTLFKFECDDVGQIEKIKVGSSCSGSRPDWFLDKVISASYLSLMNRVLIPRTYIQIDIFDLKADKEYTFECNNWLSKVEGDGRYVRELTPKNLRKSSKSSKSSSTLR